jgi:hypothetical protein
LAPARQAARHELLELVGCCAWVEEGAGQEGDELVDLLLAQLERRGEQRVDAFEYGLARSDRAGQVGVEPLGARAVGLCCSENER